MITSLSMCLKKIVGIIIPEKIMMTKLSNNLSKKFTHERVIKSISNKHRTSSVT